MYRIPIFSICIASTLFFSACSNDSSPEQSAASTSAPKYLRVLTRNAPTTYYLDRDEEAAGIEYDMAKAFAQSQGLTLQVIQKNTVGELLDALQKGEGDLIAAGLSATKNREGHYLFSESYMNVEQQVVCRRGNDIPSSLNELANKQLIVIAQSSYSESLERAKADYPMLTWQDDSELDTEQLLERVWKNKIDCTIADSNIVAINQRYYPELVVAFTLGKPDPLVWFFSKSRSELRKSVNAWFSGVRQSGQLDAWNEHYYGPAEIFDYVDTKRFIKRIDTRYKKYAADFKRAAIQHELSPTLLAAQAYQESHWNPNAKSPTGVRGMMMLTQNTAKAMGVKNRLDAKQSIDGGAKYFAKMKLRFDDKVQEPDRTWLALAAYNVGRAHLHDAQTLARKLNKNPYSWHDMQEVLPLLSQKKYYTKLKYGYARGSEPVLYVQRIRYYDDLLTSHIKN